MSAPLVSIGLPVYNGEAHLAEAIESLLAQSVGDFELIVSDNASTDATWEICNAFADRDDRVRLVRQPRNIGAPANWNYTVRQARGRFFKWASASDICAPQMIERCLEALSDGAVVLAFGRTRFIDEEGRDLGVFGRDFPVEDAHPHERFRRVCHELSINNAQSGLIRLATLRRTRLDRLYPGGDLVLMGELALLGKWRLLDEVLLSRRAGAQHFTAMRTSSQLNEMFRPGTQRESPLLNLRRHIDFMGSALRSPVAVDERMRAVIAALKGMYWDRRGLRSDIDRLLKREVR